MASALPTAERPMHSDLLGTERPMHSDLLGTDLLGPALIFLAARMVIGRVVAL
jgi:hypothetical protein